MDLKELKSLFEGKPSAEPSINFIDKLESLGFNLSLTEFEFSENEIECAYKVVIDFYFKKKDLFKSNHFIFNQMIKCNNGWLELDFNQEIKPNEIDKSGCHFHGRYELTNKFDSISDLNGNVNEEATSVINNLIDAGFNYMHFSLQNLTLRLIQNNYCIGLYECALKEPFKINYK